MTFFIELSWMCIDGKKPFCRLTRLFLSRISGCQIDHCLFDNEFFMLSCFIHREKYLHLIWPTCKPRKCLSTCKCPKYAKSIYHIGYVSRENPYCHMICAYRRRTVNNIFTDPIYQPVKNLKLVWYLRFSRYWSCWCSSGDRIFLHNIGIYPQVHTASQPRGITSKSWTCNTECSRWSYLALTPYIPNKIQFVCCFDEKAEVYFSDLKVYSPNT